MVSFADWLPHCVTVYKLVTVLVYPLAFGDMVNILLMTLRENISLTLDDGLLDWSEEAPTLPVSSGCNCINELHTVDLEGFVGIPNLLAKTSASGLELLCWTYNNPK